MNSGKPLLVGSFAVCLLLSIVVKVKGQDTGKASPTCTSRMFTVELGNINATNMQTIRIYYRLGLNGPCDLQNYNVGEYFSTCFYQVLFQATSRSTGRLTSSRYILRDTDDLGSYLWHEISNLDALSIYDIQVGYQMRDTTQFPEQVYVANTFTQTCFGSPYKPVDLSVQLFYNASYLVQWRDPPVINNSPPVCYYYVGIVFAGETLEREIEVNERSYYLSKEDSQRGLTLNVYSVYDIRCLTASYPTINNCIYKKLRSSSGASAIIEPATDYTRSQANALQSSFFLTLLLFFIVFSYNL